MIEIQMTAGTKNDETYGITYRSAYVYRGIGSGPIRIKVWSNVNRPNPHPGTKRWTEFGSIGGDGQYLDPNNKGTDEPRSILTGPECVAICADTRMNTGQPGSGQVYAAERLRGGEAVALILPDGTRIEGTVKIDRDGYGTVEV